MIRINWCKGAYRQGPPVELFRLPGLWSLWLGSLNIQVVLPTRFD